VDKRWIGPQYRPQRNAWRWLQASRAMASTKIGMRSGDDKHTKIADVTLPNDSARTLIYCAGSFSTRLSPASVT
jgi:hypothetical protein